MLLEGLFQSVAWEAMTTGTDVVISYDEIKRTYFDDHGRPRGLSHWLFKIFPKLVARWPKKEETVPLTEWRTKAGRLRNRVIHSGYTSSETESKSMIEATSEMENSIKSAVVQGENLNRSPKTLFMLIGIEGLRRRELYQGQIKAQIEAGMDEDWVGDFASFRGKLDSEIWKAS